LIGINVTNLQTSENLQKGFAEVVMAQKLKTMQLECPRQKRQVEVTYTVTGSWFDREYDVVSCPAINDFGGVCYRECKSYLQRLPGLGAGYFRQSI
jgi:hypothetical protein